MSLQDYASKTLEIVASVKPITQEQELWEKLLDAAGGFEATGTDAESRPAFVGLQALIETSIAAGLKSGEFTAAVGVIHTPLPATPLRTDGEITEGLVAEEIANDPARLATVTARPNILRSYLEEGGILITTYPENTLEKEIPGMDVLEALKNRYPNLQDSPIAADAMPADMVGATYIITDKDGETHAFSLRAYQASQQVEDGRNWGIWAGNLEQEKVAERVEAVSAFLNAHGIDMHAELQQALAAQAEIEESKTYFR